MPRPSARAALASCLLAGCFHDEIPQLTGPAATDPTDATTASTTSPASTSTAAESTTSTTEEPATTSLASTSGSTGPCPFGQDAVFYADGDGDSWGAGDPIPAACEPPPGAVEKPGDCDDAAPAINPDASELCNAVDDDCDELLDEHSPDNTTCDGCALGTYAGVPYWACQDPQNFNNARVRCQLRGPGVDLAVADDIAEHGFLRDLALASFPASPSVIHFYLGLARRMDLWDDCLDHPEPDAWQTVTGAVAPFLLWGTGEPNNSACNPDCPSSGIDDPACKRENCVEMVSPMTGAYNDHFCGVVQTGYLCEAAP